MHILFFQWNAFMQKGIETAFNRLNISYEKFFYIFSDWDYDDKFCKLFNDKLNSSPDIDVVFSVNFSPLISDICNARGIIYISWIYDAPLHIRKTVSLMNSVNRMYFFDRIQAEHYQKQGILNVHHMPLASDTYIFSDEGINETINNRLSKKEPVFFNPTSIADNDYQCDVSFIGKLYKSDYAYLCTPLNQYYRGYLEGILNAQQNIYGAYLLDDLLTDTLLEELNSFYLKASKGTFSVTKEELEFALACEITSRERVTALALLQNRCHVNLYSGDKDERLTHINQLGYVDYYTQMPKVFRNSKINLNISLKIIQSGIPLRILDILASGGFLITNYQPELLEYFEPGIDLIIYEDIPDLILKVQYYLANDDERNIIAQNGYNKVSSLFNFDDKVRQLLSI